MLRTSCMSSGDAFSHLKEMQLYHHPFSLDSQKVRLALEEKGMDYSSHRMNPLKGRNLDLDFFRMNPTGKLPVFKNGDLVIFDTMSIIEYVYIFTIHFSVILNIYFTCRMKMVDFIGRM